MADSTSMDGAKDKSLLEQILEWSEQSLPEWQRDALRRLFQRSSTELTSDDYDELFSLLKQKYKQPVSKELAAIPWAREHLPNTGENSEHAALQAMRELRYVNRIAPEQTLSFSTQGMTIVYGGNGAGKSGYTRVLKRACRARDQSEAVLSDATDSTQIGKVPEAVFDIEFAGQKKTLNWTLNKASPDELASIAVFDGKCARAYLTTEGEVAYIPYGLDVLAALATKVLPEIEKRLSAEIEKLDVDLTVLDALHGNTKVGAAINDLSATTEQSALNDLAALSEEESARLATLDKALAEEDPLGAAKRARLEEQRIANLVARIDAAAKAVDEQATKKLNVLDDKQVAAKEAVKIAAAALCADQELLPGTGGDIWRQMFEAARRYSEGVAYRGCGFPHVSDGAVCPLCQQDVGPAGDRLIRFETFLRQDAATKAEEAKAELSNVRQSLVATSIGFQLDEALATELAAHEAALPDSVVAFEKAIASRRAAMLASTVSHNWHSIPALAGDPRADLAKHRKSLGEKAKELEAAADTGKRQDLASERDELKARSQLKTELKTVTKLLSNLKSKAALEECKKDIKTTAISNKTKAFSEAGVTAALREALDSEFEKLGGVPFELKLAGRTDKGKTKYKLQMAVGSGGKLEDILSEGEQRAISIGSFLAELALAGHNGGIVFDDPVSSLDHQRKGFIAKRLAEEAKARQVIVFTHDLVFLALLQAELEKVGAACGSHWLERDNSGRPGRVRLDDSPAGTRAYRDTKLARASLKKAEGLAGEAKVQMLRQAAGQLRRTLEEVVQLHMFKEVVARWRENLMLTKLPSIHWDNALADEINDLVADLSRHIEGHSHTEEFTGGVPAIDELSHLAERVDAAIKEAKKQRQK